jgi:hypothetical protein
MTPVSSPVRYGVQKEKANPAEIVIVIPPVRKRRTFGTIEIGESLRRVLEVYRIRRDRPLPLEKLVIADGGVERDVRVNSFDGSNKCPIQREKVWPSVVESAWTRVSAEEDAVWPRDDLFGIGKGRLKYGHRRIATVPSKRTARQWGGRLLGAELAAPCPWGISEARGDEMDIGKEDSGEVWDRELPVSPWRVEARSWTMGSRGDETKHDESISDK